MLIKQVRGFKESHRKEKDAIFEQVRFFYSSLWNVLEILSVRVREEGKKNIYLVNDVSRLTRDLEHLKKINDDFGVRLKESRCLSMMSTLKSNIENDGFESEPGSTQRSDTTQFLINANGNVKNLNGLISNNTTYGHGLVHNNTNQPQPRVTRQSSQDLVKQSPYRQPQSNYQANSGIKQATQINERLSQSQYIQKAEHSQKNSTSKNQRPSTQLEATHKQNSEYSRSIERGTSKEQYKIKQLELSKPMPKAIFQKKSINTNMESQNSFATVVPNFHNHFNQQSVSDLRTQSHNLGGQNYQRADMNTKQYMSNLPSLGVDQLGKIRNLDLETQQIESQMAEFRSKQTSDNLFGQHYPDMSRDAFSSSKQLNVNVGRKNSNNAMINNLNLKMLSVTSERNMNPQRMMIQNQSSVSTLGECTYNKRHVRDIGRVSDMLHHFDGTIKEEDTHNKSESEERNNSGYSPYRNQVLPMNYGYDMRNEFSCNQTEHTEDDYYTEQGDMMRHKVQRQNFNNTYQPVRYAYNEDLSNYDTPVNQGSSNWGQEGMLSTNHRRIERN